MEYFSIDKLQMTHSTLQQVNVGLIYYSEQAVIQQHLRDSAVLLDSLYDIDTMPFVGGSTNTAAALDLMNKEMFNG